MRLIVSYTRADQDLVKPLVDGLRRIGHEVWFDRELSGGESWWASILSNIRASDALILAVSVKELESDACQREVAYARSVGKPVLPVMVAAVNVALLPSDLVSEQFVDFTQPSSERAFMLAGAIGKLPAAAALPDPLPEPPPVPMSYLNEIAGRIYGGKVLTLDEQLATVGRLRQGLQVDDDRETATRLLERLKNRPDTLYATAREIESTLAEGARGRPTASEGLQGGGPWVNDRSVPQAVEPLTPPHRAPSRLAQESGASALGRHRRLGIILGGVAAVAVVIVVVAVIGVPRLLNPSAAPTPFAPPGTVSPATGAAVSNNLLQLNVTGAWADDGQGLSCDHGSCDSGLTNTNSSGSVFIYYASQVSYSSAQDALRYDRQDDQQHAKGPVTDCLSQHPLTVGGKPGVEEGYRYDTGSGFICDIEWEAILDSKEYNWDIKDAYSRMPGLEQENAAMQETVSWKM